MNNLIKYIFYYILLLINIIKKSLLWFWRLKLRYKLYIMIVILLLLEKLRYTILTSILDLIIFIYTYIN